MIIVLHDCFESPEGEGRLALNLAQTLKADLGYGFKSPNHPFFDDLSLHGKEFPLGAFVQIPLLRQYNLVRAFANKTQFLKDYNRIIYSGVFAPLAVRNHPHGKNIYYCENTPRFLYDQKDFFLSLVRPWQRPVLYAFYNFLRSRYEESIRKMDVIAASSKHVQQRIKKLFGLDSVVVPPPCNPEKFVWLGQEDFYLSTSRHDPLKRVDLVVDAFRDLPDKKLIVVSGGPELKQVQEAADKTHNVKVLGWVLEEELRELLGRCIATVYIPQDEDFGMSPVESMAAGKPVIGVAEGGLLETVVHEQTGFLMKPDPSIVEIIEAVLTVSPEEAKKMRPACEERAQMFRQELFINAMKELL